MAKPRTFRLPDEIFSYLELESEKRSLPVSDVLRQILESIIKGNPVLTAIVDIDKEIKTAKLEETREKVRKLRNDNIFFESNGYYPTKPSKYVERVVVKTTEEKKSNSLVSEKTVTPTLTEEQWNLVFPAFTRFDEKSKIIFCDIPDCVHGCQRIETARNHITSNHEDLLMQSLRGLTS